jgi:riboflavin kinase/FMN adenylyltransferase
MQVHRNLSDFPSLHYAVVTSGTFDGVHLGHQKILMRLKEIAKQHNGQTVVITFYPHPRNIINQGKNEIKELNTLDEKIDRLKELGIDYLLILPFTSDFSQISADEFINKVYIQGINTKKLVIGYDHRFGKNREGGLDYLIKNAEKYNFNVEEISRQDLENITISSTKIRQALSEGNILIANQYLGYHYHLEGIIEHGDKIGRSIGFPTANLIVKETQKLIPADGIYAVKTYLKGKLINGMMYIGNRPTISGNLEKRLEVNLFDFEEDIYNEIMKVYFMDKIRNDEKFESLELMQIQLKKDEIEAKKILEKL